MALLQLSLLSHQDLRSGQISTGVAFRILHQIQKAQGISNLYCQTPRQKVEIGAITNIAPATLESIQLSLDTALGTWKNIQNYWEKYGF